jgi:hypothetical protein
MLATRRARAQQFERPPALDLMAVIFAAQLSLFALQETAEALLTGRAVPTAGDLLLWGTLGQLPIAALAALALSWLTAGLRIALQDLSHARVSARLTPSAGVAPAAGLAPAPALVVAWSPGRRLLRRGPPGPAR